MTRTSSVPPAWVLALPMLSFGMTIGFVIVPLPQMLASQGVSGGRIAIAVAVMTSPAFWGFLLAPVLDVWLRRRTYALMLAVLAGVAASWVVLYHSDIMQVQAIMLIAVLAIDLFAAALGGWTGSLIEREHSTRLGAWMTAYNIAGNGVGILLAGYLTQHVAGTWAAIVWLLALLAPLLVFPLIPAPPPNTLLARESFGRFAREVAALLRRREVLVALLLFILPSASFALTNVLGGWGESFQAAPDLVNLLGGIGTVIAGIVGCALIPMIAARTPLRPLYLGIGLLGAIFTLCLLLAPRSPGTYGTAFIGENIFQAAAITVSTAITFEVIGPANPLAATTFALLISTANLPIVYMEIIDGHGFDWHGVTGAFLSDAIVSGSACLLLALVLRRWLLPPRSHGLMDASSARAPL